MSTQDDLNALRQSSAQEGENLLIPLIPQLPQDVLKRFPSLAKWQEEMERWRKDTIFNLRGN